MNVNFMLNHINYCIFPMFFGFFFFIILTILIDDEKVLIEKL